MTAAPHQSPVVLAARQRLDEGREKLRRQHESGSPGIQVCTRLTDLLDLVILEVYEATLADLGQPEVQGRVAIVAHGGYGRRDVAPYSDVDIMLLCAQDATEDVIPLARRFTQHIYDTGLELGFSLRTPKQACQLALKDASVFTSLAESRFLAGSIQLYTRYFQSFKRQTRFRSQALIAQIEAARDEEKTQFGDTVYLLRPNVKRTRGGLRDLQMVRWVGFARYGETDPENLQRMGALLNEDRKVLRRSYDYLLRLRNELHFHANRSQDVLEKGEQLRLAEKRGFKGDDVSLPVEQFMQEYFEHTGNVRYRVAHFVAGAKQRGRMFHWLARVMSRRMESVYRIGPVHISVVPKALPTVAGDLEEVLQLMDFANDFDKRIEHRTWETIREAMIERPPQLTSNAAKRFMSLMSQPSRLASLLRRLHQLRALEILVPPMTHARSRMQFNEYHKYTVDEHSLRAVDYATSLVKEEQLPVGRAYRKLDNKSVLHLAILMHDLGKGFPEDHSVLGARLAGETADRLGLSQDDKDTLQFLILKHLQMAHLAFRHNLADESVIVQFAVEVGRLDWLRMLYVLTCADLAAVGPGVLNKWKMDLLNQLYYRTREKLASDATNPTERQQHRLREEVIERVKAAYPGESEVSLQERTWWQEQLESLPWAYFNTRNADEVYDDLLRIKQLPGAGQGHHASAWGRYLEDRQTVEYTMASTSQEGVFYRVTGALTAKGHQILSADINTLACGIVLDSFYVQDLDFTGEPPPERIEEVAQRLVNVVQSESDDPPAFRRVWRNGEDTSQFSEMPTVVKIDNATSEQHTILSVFTYDRLGLLYAIAKTLFDLGLSVGFAKIGTHLDQVVDVFYVTDRTGKKLKDQNAMDHIANVVRSKVQQLDDG